MQGDGQVWRRGGSVVHQPHPVDAVLFFAQTFTQLALQVQVLLARSIAVATGHTHQQPLPFERSQRDGGAIKGRRREVRQGALRLDQFAIVTSAIGAHHVIREVRSNHGRCADK
ncbi:hypothetical protein D3C72_1981060 [compost metagenome]